MQHRDKRVADAIKDSVAKIVLTELSDPKIGFVTVTRCHISRDLKNATVYFSIMGDEQTRQRSFEHLQGARGYIRRRLGQQPALPGHVERDGEEEKAMPGVGIGQPV